MLIYAYRDKGPQWKPGKDISHLKKRIARQELAMETTLEDYNLIIVNIIHSFDNHVYIYFLESFNQRYFVFRADHWIVIIGEDLIMETAMISSNPDRYLANEKGYTYLGTIKEVLEWNTFI